jgi:hypothetical protein
MMHDQNSSDTTTTYAPRFLAKRKGGEKLDAASGKPVKKSKHSRASKAKWSPEEDEILSRAVMISGEGNWKKIAQSLHDRSHLQCLHRWQKVLNPALVKGPWKEEEDAKLTELVEKYGPKDWSTIASHIPGRIGKQCRERWFNHLSPDVRKTNWTPEEDRIIIEAHSRIGNKWTNISKLLEGRPANAIKNHWNSTLLKRIQDSSGEVTPRRDRTRNKKPAPMRATEFDFRTHLQHIDDASDCSPQQYQLSPNSSPELPYQEPVVNLLRFQYPAQEAGSQVFFNSYSDHTAVPPAPNSYTSAAWDSWPAPNVIHLTPSVPMPLPGHSISFSHLGQAAPNNFANTNNINNPTTTINVYDVEYNLGLADTTSDENMGLYSSAPSNSTLPVELQYCFDHPPQQQGALSTFSLPGVYAPLLESAGVNTVNSANVNVNMGLLNLDLPGLMDL